MNKELWKNVLNFNLDGRLSEYGFTTRLENENFWTEGFARDAVIEYKKFMYLAAVADYMVSPSAIVDIVWHQHLIFTQSYEDFCVVLGKKIAHIPSTHQTSDFAQFKFAKETTTVLYNQNFGPQPPAFWDYEDIYGPLLLERARYTITEVLSAGLLLLVVLIAAGYLVLRPLYITIENPDFLIGYGTIVIVSIAALCFYDRIRLTQMVDSWDKSAFIFNLTALELVYLSKNQIRAVINGVVNRLILDNKILVLPGQLLEVQQLSEAENGFELCVLQTILADPGNPYHMHLKTLALKPVFNKIARSMDAFNNYFTQSVPFIKLFIVNFSLLSVVFVLGAVRLITGIVRDRPVNLILMAVLVCLVIMAVYLKYLSVAIGITTLPRYYKKNILPEKPEISDWDWEYFLLGNAVFDFSFIPLAGYSGNVSVSGSDSGGSSCSSGGDSGSSCGGCGST
jgi:uncharacterized protein (TIGR04222 family)